MTAWEVIQMDWAENTEKNNLSGILLWDLSAAFDTLDVDIFCEKIVLYGFLPNTVKWFRSFLSGRTQRVKIGANTSAKKSLTSGVQKNRIQTERSKDRQIHRQIYKKKSNSQSASTLEPSRLVFLLDKNDITSQHLS